MQWNFAQEAVNADEATKSIIKIYISFYTELIVFDIIYVIQ